MPSVNNAVSTYKSLSSNDYTVTPFTAYANKSYTYISGSTSNSTDVQLFRGTKYTGGLANRVANFENELFDSTIQTFYSGLAATSYGIVSSSYYPSQSLFSISVAQSAYGESIAPGSFTASIGSTYMVDDSAGKLIVSELGTSYVVGNIFYDMGIAIIKPSSSLSDTIGRNGMSVVSGSNLKISFQSSITLYEHAAITKIFPAEFNFSVYNPTSDKVPITGSSSTVLELMTSQSLTPYITTIGLYNSTNELLAVAKLSTPTKRTFDTIQTFIIKFDT